MREICSYIKYSRSKNRRKFFRCLDLIVNSENVIDPFLADLVDPELLESVVDPPIPDDRNSSEEQQETVIIEEEVDDDENTYGVRHVSPLNTLNKFKMISGILPDEMHFAKLGIGKQFTDCFCDKNKSPLTQVLTSADMKEIDNLLEEIQVPHQSMRLTRSISDRGKWKAKEWEIGFYTSVCLFLNYL